MPGSKLERGLEQLKRSFNEISRSFQARGKGYLVHFLIGIITVLVIIQLFPRERSFEFADLREGEIYIGEQVVAPFTFSINKSQEEYKRDIAAAKRAVPPVFLRSDSLAELYTFELQEILDDIEKVLKSLVADSLKAAQLRDILSKYQIIASEAEISFFINNLLLGPRSAHEDTSQTEQVLVLDEFRAALLQITKDIYAIGVLNVAAENLPYRPVKIAVSDGDEEIVEQTTNFYHVDALNEILTQKLRERFTSDAATKTGYNILSVVIKPNILYDEQETRARIEEAVRKVPRARGTVLAKERIIDSHEKITREHILKLRSLAEAKAAMEGNGRGVQVILSWLGRLLMVFLGLLFIVLFLYSNRRSTLTDAKKLVMISITLLLVLILAHFINKFSLSEYFIPVALTAMLLTIFLDHEIAFVGLVSLAILLGGLRGNEFSIMLITFVVGTAGIQSVRRVRSRSWIFKSILWVTGGYILSIGALELLRYSSLSQISTNLSYGVLNGILSPILAYGLMVIYEYAFDMTTDATLLELSDLNKPLLRKLAMRAPGTYHHSILLGSLAEAAAEAIGANSLLARVGSYYHDIGKMDKPEYFVENQVSGVNPHDKLSPSMSCLILVSHVKRGLEIAEEYNLPKEICAFISEHHGTNLISYFYKKALEHSDDKELSDAEFRYPGPKPQSKETGIVMLADAVEAASRTLKDPSVTRLRNMVSTIIDDRFKNCELDDSPLTLRDLNHIQDAFINILTGIFHGRIEYPDQEKLGEPPTKETGEPEPTPILAEPTNGEN